MDLAIDIGRLEGENKWKNEIVEGNMNLEVISVKIIQ